MLRHSKLTARSNGLVTALLVLSVLLFIPAQEAAAACRGAWAEGVNYAAGDTVTYNGSVYTARVAHGCNGCGWNPVAAPSLWATGGTCGTTPTPTARPTPTPTTTPPPSGVVCFYQHTNYSGTSFCSGEGGFNAPAGWNDFVSSVRVQSGYRVELFADANLTGTVLTLAADEPNLVNRSFNDLMSSYRVLRATSPTPTPAPGARSAVYGGGPFYTGGTAVMNTLRASGFTTVILWSIHVHANGNLVLNDQLVVSNGAYVGNAAWPSQLATLKQAPTSVNRIEVSVGSWGVRDFETIRDLMNAQGTGTNSILYRNFLALKNATRADAVNFDDESLYDVNTTVRFGVMLADMGLKISYAPYTNPSFWASSRAQTLSQRPGSVDRIYLQVYAGGAGNNPASWNNTFGGFKVDPGVWSRHGSGCAEGDGPGTVQSKMAGWKSSAGITGGFMWLYDDMQACSSQGTPAQYAGAINNAVGGP
jgi:hypothetical protein